jgi:hypothetical protein
LRFFPKGTEQAEVSENYEVESIKRHVMNGEELVEVLALKKGATATTDSLVLYFNPEHKKIPYLGHMVRMNVEW